MNPRNAQRMLDLLAEGQKRAPNLMQGMTPWYVMDPAYWRLVELEGPERAKVLYDRFNKVMTPFSTNANVMAEIHRGSAANMMAERGEFPLFARYGGVSEPQRGADFPAALRDVKSHVRHGNQWPPAGRWLETGEHGFGQQIVKNPTYTLASGVPETGFQTRWAVPDAHLTRLSGMSESRRTTQPEVSMKGPEYRSFGPWFRGNVAEPAGLEAVPTQASLWGLGAPQTGVETAIGAPKLELLAQRMWERAQKLGIDPRAVRDQVLLGKEHAVFAPLAIGGGAAATSREPREMPPAMSEIYAQDRVQQ